MARRNGKQRFDPNAEHYVRKPFKAGGRTLQRGERYDPKRDMLSMRRVRQLYDANYLGQQQVDEPKVSKPAVDTAPEPKSEPEPVEAEAEQESSLDGMTKTELVELAKSEGVPYAAQKNKSELIELLSQ